MNKNDRLIKENPQLDVSIIKLIRAFDPTENGKYTQFLIDRFIEHFHETIEHRQQSDTLNHLHPNRTAVEDWLMRVLMDVYQPENLESLWDFAEHHKEKRVPEPDIQKYKGWEDIHNAVYLADMKSKEKDYREQIINVFEDDEWFILRPLTFNASLAYGATTKWCTASRNNPDYFYSYCDRGILVYIINKKNGIKYGMYAEIIKSKMADKQNFDISFWSAEDKKVESLMVDLPNEILSIIRGLLNDKTQTKPNKYFFAKPELEHYRPNEGKAERPHIILHGVQNIPQAINDIEMIHDAEYIGEERDEEEPMPERVENAVNNDGRNLMDFIEHMINNPEPDDDDIHAQHNPFAHNRNDDEVYDMMAGEEMPYDADEVTEDMVARVGRHAILNAHAGQGIYDPNQAGNAPNLGGILGR